MSPALWPLEKGFQVTCFSQTDGTLYGVVLKSDEKECVIGFSDSTYITLTASSDVWVQGLHIIFYP
jgi:hypothetical protein